MGEVTAGKVRYRWFVRYTSLFRKEENKFHFENLEDESLRHQAEEEILEYLRAKNN